MFYGYISFFNNFTKKILNKNLSIFIDKIDIDRLYVKKFF